MNYNLNQFRKLFYFALFGFFAVALTSCGDDDNDIDFDDDGERLFVSSNNSSTLTSIDVSDIEEDNNPVSTESYSVSAMDADGVYYADDGDVLYQVNRSSSVVNVYDDISDIDANDNLTPSGTSTSNFSNGREITVSNGIAIVADDADPNQLVFYTVDESNISFQKTVTTDINLWGIQAIGNDLWAISDNTSDVVVYRNIFSAANGSTVTPTRTVTIEGITRTHGLVYDIDNDVAVFTDVADGGVDDDGGFALITGFSSKFNNSTTISMSDQIRVYGSNTLMGNPVDVEYDHSRGFIHIAERANGGGRVLIFEVPAASGNLSPVVNLSVAGASAVFLQR